MIRLSRFVRSGCNRKKRGDYAMTNAVPVAAWAFLVASWGWGRALAGEAVPDGKTYIDASTQNKYVATDSNGAEIAVTNGADAVITAVYNGNCRFEPCNMTYSSLTFAAERRRDFWTDNHYVNIGAGGISFLTNSVFSTGRSSETSRNLTLTADQTWSGMDHEMTDRPVLSVGHPFYQEYYRMGLGVSDEVHALTIEKFIDVWFTGQNSALGEVDLTVRAPARLYLARERWLGTVSTVLDARLAARSLTLAGDGDCLLLGQPPTARWKGSSVSICAALDSVHYAPVLKLQGGADLAAGSECVFAVPEVSVSGTAADVSAWTGPFVVTQALTSVALSGGVTLDLSAAELSEAGVAASLAFTGSGTVRLAPATFALTGALSLAAGVTLEAVGPGDFGRATLVGAGDIRLDPGADGVVVVGDLAQATGSLTLVSGTAILVGGRGGLPTVTVAEGANLLESGGLVVTDIVRPEAELTVREGETLQVYGSGLTAQTRLTLDGGAVAFHRNATIASPVDVRQASVVGADASVTGEISGSVQCAITNGTGFVVRGLGCHVFSGGFECGVPDGDWRSLARTNSFLAYGGDVILKTGRYFFGNGMLYVGIEDSSWDIQKSGLPPYCCRRLTIGEGAEVGFAEWSNSSGAARPCIYVRAPKDSAEYQQEVTFEIAAGGKLTIPRNHRFDAGNNQSKATVELTGGTLTMNADSRLFLGTGYYSTGTLVLRDGVLTLARPLRPDSKLDVARVLWHGGTIRLGPAFASDRTLLEGYGGGAETPLKASCQILGDACVLDLGDCAGAAVTNTPAGFDRGEWIGAGALTVRGGALCRELVANAFPAGIRLTLENGARVRLPASARVYDPAKSNFAWVAPYPESNFSSTDGWLVPADTLALAEFSPGAPDVALVAESSALTLTVGTVRVPSGGWWNNAAPCFASLGGRWSFTNFVFAAGAEWNVTRDSTGGNVLRVPGDLTLPTAPETLVLSRSSSVPFGERVLAQADGTVTGGPAVEKNGSFPYELMVDAASRRVRLSCAGGVLVVR
ncbi:MAG: hypothetical protein ACI4RD_01145 [Kiritimatiellia bacterium]